MAEAADRQLGFCWAGVVLALCALSPFGPAFASQLWHCPFKTLTGFPCPSCGTTRAALALARFDFWGALVSYPLPTIAWLLFLLGGLGAGWLAWQNRPLPQLPPLSGWTKFAIIAAILANWAYAIATGV